MQECKEDFQPRGKTKSSEPIIWVSTLLAFWFWDMLFYFLPTQTWLSLLPSSKLASQPQAPSQHSPAPQPIWPTDLSAQSIPSIQRQFQANHERHEDCWMCGAGFGAPGWCLCSFSGFRHERQPATIRLGAGRHGQLTVERTSLPLSWSVPFALATSCWSFIRDPRGRSVTRGTLHWRGTFQCVNDVLSCFSVHRQLINMCTCTIA